MPLGASFYEDLPLVEFIYLVYLLARKVAIQVFVDVSCLLSAIISLC